MRYLEFVELYERISETSKRLEKISLLSGFLKKLTEKKKYELIYLLQGRILPDYDVREMGISQQLVLKTIAVSYGISNEKVLERFNKIGDLGEVAQEFSDKRRQAALFSKALEADKVFNNLRKILDITGTGAVEKKIFYVSELLSAASGKEAKYIIRTLLGDLRIGISSSSIIDALASAFFEGEHSEDIQMAYDLSSDFALIFEKCKKGLEEIKNVGLIPGKPMNVMLAVKVGNIDEAFEICGKPAAIEQKYDGFRMLISKDKHGEIKLFTRRLEEVTKQFPDVVSAVKEKIKGDTFILDSEIVGFDAKTGKYTPFEHISQRIKRKYGIDELLNKLPVEINVFDCLFYNDKNVMDLPFQERRKIVEKIIKTANKIIRPSVQIITSDEKEVMRFYEEALKLGEEGIMIKKLDAPYKPGRKVGYMCKLKPEMNDLDLVIIGAEPGTGKRGGLFTSYILACRDEDKLLEIGKVSSGLKEKEEEGFTFEQMTKLLKPLILSEDKGVIKVEPKIVVSVNYQNIQESPSYSSGYALRFPRITNYRPDKSTKDIALLEEIKREIKKFKRK